MIPRDTASTAHVDRLVDELRTLGDLTDPVWRDALHAVPRHLFVPPEAWVITEQPERAAYGIDRGRDEDEWLKAVYSNSCIVLQVNDGAGDPAAGQGRWTSALTFPAAVVRLLELLDPLPGHRVLEIGTGSGWAAGLLSRRCGADSVVAVEIDEALAAMARGNLAHAGQRARVLCEDGANGAPAWEPYDRVFATCSARRVPPAWVQQTRPGGAIVVVYQPGVGPGYSLRLTVLDDDIATGRFAGTMTGQVMRAQRHLIAPSIEEFGHHPDQAELSGTDVDPRTIAQAPPGAWLAISALVPGVRLRLAPAASDSSGACTFWLVETRPDAVTAGSWARVLYEPGRATYPVEQYGERRLWDLVRAAYLRWVAWGSPELTRFGLTVTPADQRVWLDTPAQRISLLSDQQMPP